MKKKKTAKKQQTSMSFLTSLGLSANNLRTKKGRTILTAFAGSIGIIGIALILALSSGVNDYIQSLEEDTMAEYPLQITSSEMDITSLLSSVSPAGGGPGGLVTARGEDTEISVTKVITTMFSQMNSNDLASLKEYMESGESDILAYVKAIEYSYNVDPLIYLVEEDGVRQVNPDTSMSSSGNMLTNLISSSSSFYSMPENTELYENQYELKAGRWPENYNECILVLTSSGSISDYLLYTLGLRDYSELEAMMEQYSQGEEIDEIEDIGTYSYSDVLGITYKVINSADLYAYDEEYDLWVDKSDNEEYVETLVKNGEDLTIVGVVQPLEDAITANLSSGINYPMSLVYHMSDLASSSDAVLAQMENPDVNIFTGNEFGEESDFDLSSMLSIDEDALTDAFSLEDAFSDLAFDPSSLELDFDLDSFDFDTDSIDFDASGFDFELDLDLSGLDFDAFDMDLDLSGMDLDFSDMDLDFDLSDLDFDFSEISPEMPDMDLSGLMSGAVNVDPDTLAALSGDILEEFFVSDEYQDFSAYLTGEEGKKVITDTLEEAGCLTVTVDTEGLAEVIRETADARDPGDESESAAGEDGAGDSSFDVDGAASRVADAVDEYLENLSASGEDMAGAYDSAELEDTIRTILLDYADEEGETGGTDTDTSESETLTARVAAAVSAYVSDNAHLSVDITDEGASSLAEALTGGYEGSLRDGFCAYLTSDAVVMQMTRTLMGMIDAESLQAGMSQMMNTVMGSYTEALMGAVTQQMSAAMGQMMESVMEEMTDTLSEQMTSVLEEMMESVMESVMEEMTDTLSEQISSVMEEMMESIMEEITDQLTDSLTEALEGMMDEMTDQMSDALSESFDIDSDTLSEAFGFNMDSTDLTELLTSMSRGTGTSYDSNLNSLGYVDMDHPSQIDIYPLDFDSKEQVVAILDDYNERCEAAGETDKVISYTDMVATMMSSVTTIINIVSYVLIAFIAVSLIVSSIMISIITQISVMERTREIGILRAMGASKANISEVFNAETFIIGTCSGLIGVIVTEILIIPINAVIHAVSGSTSVNAVLTANNAAVLVILSIAITVLSGLVPALKAARQDPVTALRTE